MRELLSAELAGELLASVFFHVNGEMGGLREGLVTDVAAPGSVASVGFQMRVESVPAGKTFVAMCARERFLAGVSAHMYLELRRYQKENKYISVICIFHLKIRGFDVPLVAAVTCIRLFTGVDAHVDSEFCRYGETFETN